MEREFSEGIEHYVLGDHYLAQGYLYFVYMDEYPEHERGKLFSLSLPNPVQGAEVLRSTNRKKGRRDVYGYLVISEFPNVNLMNIAGGWKIEPVNDPFGDAHIVVNHPCETDDTISEHFYIIADRRPSVVRAAFARHRVGTT